MLLKAVGFLGLCAQTVSHKLNISTSCTHGPENRRCWLPGYDILTDYNDAANTPRGKLVEYDLTLSQQPLAPDGYERPGMVVNGQFPGPAIEANWGDTLRITVHNNLTNNNGTAIHWHGMRQLYTNWQDGTPGITQCPIKPGDTKVYEFRATQYGTTWYHSHFSVQYSDGLYGPLVIHGPSSMDYDVDLGPWMLGDWFHSDVFGMNWVGHFVMYNTLPNSTILNGKGKFSCDPITDIHCTGRGEYFETAVQPGKKYKFVIIGSSTLFSYKFWIDGHDLTVISADMVPIQPYITDVLSVGVGQRYEIIIEATADLDHGTNFWIKAKPCGNKRVKIRQHMVGIIRYNQSDTADPVLSAESDRQLNHGCEDPDPRHLIPVVKQTVQAGVNGMDPANFLTIGKQPYPNPWAAEKDSKYFRWVIKDRPQNIKWEEPSLKKLVLDKEPHFSADDVPIYLDYETGAWVHFLVTSNYSLDDVSTPRILTTAYHPMHLHGHDLAIIAQGSGPFTDDVVPNFDNPPRRDTANLAEGGYLWVAFQVNNPGAWMFHCHLMSHASSGLALQFIEQPRKIKALVENAGVGEELLRRCDAWSKWSHTMGIQDGLSTGG